MGQILNLFSAFKSCDSLFVLFLIVLSECEESAETAWSSPLALSLTLPLPRSPGDIWCWRHCLYRERKKEKKTWQVSSARHEDRWRGEHAEFRSALCVFLAWKLSGFTVEWKKNTHPSIREEKRNLRRLVWIEDWIFFLLVQSVRTRQQLALWWNTDRTEYHNNVKVPTTQENFPGVARDFRCAIII